MTDAENAELIDDVAAGEAEEASVGEDHVEESPADNSQAEEKPKEKAPPLTLQTKVSAPSACERHVVVEVARADIDRYIEEEYKKLQPNATVPGFRAGKAPAKLVRSRFKDQVVDTVKGRLLLDSMTQVSDEQKFAAISEPDLKVEGVVLPDDGPLTFEFSIEVRPEFEMPVWQGLTLERPVRTLTDDDVDKHLAKLLQKYSRLAESREPAAAGDYLTVNMKFAFDGNPLSSLENVSVVARPKLSFRDATFDGFDALVSGCRPGDIKAAKVKLSPFLDDETLRDREIDAEFEIVKIEHSEPPHLTASFLDEIGGFSDVDDLKSAVREEMERQFKFRQQQKIREQITRQLTLTASWDLPPRLLRRQARREVQRVVLELQSAGFGNDVIQKHANQLQQNSLMYTSRALKEHFILERIAEENSIDAEPADYDREIQLIAEQSAMSPRRVRARLEKRGEIDSLRNQIVERKVIELITSQATVKDTPYEEPAEDTTALDHAILGEQKATEIPEATSSGDATPLPELKLHG